jgi:formylmethanofuran dehydrogenase subunit A
MTDRGHLGLGAIGDIAIYKLNPEKMDGHLIEKAFSNAAFSNAAYTIKDGEIVVKDGEIVKSTMGTTIVSEGNIKEELIEELIDDVKSKWRARYSINFNNYAIGDYYTPKLKIIKGTV